MMQKRQRIGTRYISRRKDGTFSKNVDVGRSLSADRRTKAKRTVKAGYGDKGDVKSAETFNALDMELDRNDCCELWVEKMYDNGRIGFGEASNLLASIEMDGLKCSSLGSSNCSKENMGAESFGAESRFDTLANKVAKDYESKGYSDKEAMEIGKKVAYSQGVKKYGKAGMTRLSKEGRKKSMQKSADSYSLNAELGQVNTMQATQSWQNSEPYATLEGYNPVDSVIASPPLGRGATQDFGAEYEGHQGYDDKMDESMGMRHGGKHSQSMKDRRDEASAMDKRHSRMGRKYDDVMTMDAEYDSPYGPRQSTNFGMVGMGNDFAQNAAETFSAEGGSEFMTGARYGAGAIIGITGATLILGTVMNLFMRK